MAEMRVDLPAFGRPTSATSARSLSSSARSSWAPFVPGSARLGARFVEVANRAFPLPPLPPAATRSVCPSSMRSPTTSPVSRSFTTVPTGTETGRATPFFPWQLSPLPWPPRPAAKRLWNRKGYSVFRPRSATSVTLPPSPPSPPEGPPRGTNFSRRNATQPFPPSPPTTWMTASSMNMLGRIFEGAHAPSCLERKSDGARKRKGDPVSFRNQRGAEVQAVVLADGENLGEQHLRALLQGLFREALDTHDVALCDAHLLASGPDDCVHAYLDFPNKTADKHTRPEARLSKRRQSSLTSSGSSFVSAGPLFGKNSASASPSLSTAVTMPSVNFPSAKRAWPASRASVQKPSPTFS